MLRAHSTWVRGGRLLELVLGLLAVILRNFLPFGLTQNGGWKSQYQTLVRRLAGTIGVLTRVFQPRLDFWSSQLLSSDE